MENKPFVYDPKTGKIKKRNKKPLESNNTESDIAITPEMKEIVELVEHSYSNIYLTGSPGTGKSTLLQYIKAKTNKNYQVLAPIGVAAINVGGRTIHSFFGFGNGVQGTQMESKSSITENRINTKTRNILDNLELLIIDEVSMVRADILDGIDGFLKKYFKNNTPFGGIQILLIGDLYQLPPILANQSEKDWFEDKGYKTKFFFGAHVYNEMNLIQKELTRNFRQKDDKQFIELLGRIRQNKFTTDDIQLLNSRLKPPHKNSIMLCSKREIAKSFNAEELNKLSTKLVTSRAKIDGDFEEKHFPGNLTLELKKGMRCMTIVNDSPEKRYFNGSTGNLINIHYDDSGNMRSLQIQFDHLNYPVNIEKYECKNVKRVYNKDEQKMEEEIIGRLTQFPILPAWAITIHKSQGKTFDNIEVDIGTGAFAHGQVYVALSRCTSLNGITLKSSIYKKDIICDQLVVQFSNGEWISSKSENFKDYFERVTGILKPYLEKLDENEFKRVCSQVCKVFPSE